MTPVQYALRWNGSKWAATRVTARPDTVVDAAVFGRKDVWAFGVAPSDHAGYGPAVVRHWNGTVWRTVPVPVGTPVTVDGVAPEDISRPGCTSSVSGIFAVPGTGSSWATGMLTPVKAGPPKTDILRYTP